MFDYEGVLCKALLQPEYLNSNPSSNILGKDSLNIAHSFKEKHLWVMKATGLGVTELMLRFMAWLCLCNDDYRNSQMVIVTGSNQELAIKLIKRMKALFEPWSIFFVWICYNVVLSFVFYLMWFLLIYYTLFGV